MPSSKEKPGVYIPPHRRRQQREDSMGSLEQPSKITDRKFIRMPKQKNVVKSDEEWNKCGKWLWFARGDAELQDHLWKELQPLLTNKILIMIKTSTAAMTDEPGMIACFTKPEKEAIKRAVKAIRDVTKDDTIFYYKENGLTDSNIDHRNGQKMIATYMYTAKGRFYKRDHIRRWILDEDLPAVCQLASFIQNMSNADPELLPSHSNQDKHYLEHPAFFEKEGSTGWWSILCDNSDRDECGWTEADKVWIAATRLYEEHSFERIAYLQKPQISKNRKPITYISCYVTSFSCIKTLIGSVKKVMESVQYTNVVYFYIYDGPCDDNTWKYKFTAEGEFYEKCGENKCKYDKFIF